MKIGRDQCHLTSSVIAGDDDIINCHGMKANDTGSPSYHRLSVNSPTNLEWPVPNAGLHSLSFEERMEARYRKVLPLAGGLDINDGQPLSGHDDR